MKKKLINWFWMGGGFSPSSEYQLVLDRATTLGVNKPTLPVQQLQDTLMRAIVNSVGLANISYFYVLADNADNNTFSYINWKSPSLFNLAAVGVPVKTVNQGIAGGVGIALNTGWDLTNNGGGISSQNDDGIALWCFENSTTPGSSMGSNSTSGGNRLTIQIRDASDDILWRYNSSGTTFLTFAASVASSIGSTMMLRRASNDVKFIKSGIELGTATNATTGAGNVDDYLLAENNNGAVANASTLKHSIFMRGRGTSMYTNFAAIHTAFNNYMTALALI